MASAAGNQNSWSPYDYRDCSLGMCSIYCPQFCYFIFPPPPPPDDDSASPFSPVIIAVIGVLASAFVLVSYYTIVTRYCTGRTQSEAAYSADGGAAGGQWQAQAAASGLEEAAIKAITVCRYRRGEGLIEGSECAVCLSEFEEEECLRLLPKCSHAFHLPCIDTWLKSHSNCPLCRAAVVAVASPPPHFDSDSYELRRPGELIVVVDEQELQCLVGAGGVGDAVPESPNRNAEAEESGGEGVSHLRRSVSLGNVRVSMGEFGEDLGRKRCRSWRELNFS